jgi:hypothetical protein
VTPLFRPCTPADLPFVISNWSASFKISHSAGLIQSEDWADIMRPQIQKVIQRPDARTVIAYEKSDPAFFYGFISGDTSGPTPVVYYVYVKAPFRKHGHARRLFQALGVDPTKPFLYTCKTAIVSKLSGQVPMARWNPLLARFPKGTHEDHKSR